MAGGDNNDKQAGSSKKRKRKEKLQQYGIDLPEIPGVPVQVIPLLVHALKASTKFFQHEASTAYNDDWEQRQLEEENNSAVVGGPLDGVLNRIDSTSQDNREEKQQQQQRKVKMQDAVQTWLEGVKRFAKKDRHHNTNNTTQDQDQVKLPDEDGLVIPATAENNNNHNNNQGAKKSVALCCFEYIWDLGREHKRLAVRRAALNLNRHLLDKSSDCRRLFLQESNHLWKWVQMLSAGKDGFDETKQRLWQKEGHYLLLHLLSQNYDDLYPKLRVSEQFLRQACSLEEATYKFAGDEDDFGSTTNMVVLRQLRDIALEHGAEEIKRVDRLIVRAHKCMDILVPRMGTSEEGVSDKKAGDTENVGKQIITASDDDDDDEDIDWEDGWDDDKSEIEGVQSGSVSHAQAVERTLQMMESIGGFNSGKMEIDFSKPNPDPSMTEHLSAQSSGPEMAAARERFTRCAQFLSDRHLPRIRAWLEGLAKADRLYSPSPQAALVLMPPVRNQNRDELQQHLNGLKKQVLSVLESAAKLGLQGKATP